MYYLGLLWVDCVWVGVVCWSIEDQINETQFHINCLRSIILGIEIDANPCNEIIRTLSFAMSVLRDRREYLVRIKEYSGGG